jgi:hypothetical protein
MKRLIILTFTLVCLILGSFVFAADSVTYDFEEVNVLYAAEFIATPIEGVDSSNTWISDLMDINSDEPECGLWRGGFLTSDVCNAEFEEGGAKKYGYQCYDGTEGELGDDSSCKSRQDWMQMAEEDCQSRCPEIHNKKLVITYGIVELKKEGIVLITEEFIKIGQGENAKRFLVNSGGLEYFKETEEINVVNSIYWSAKKLEGANVVKDKTLPIYVACMTRELNENNEAKSFFLSFITHKESIRNECEEMMFEADLGTLHDSGDPSAKADWMK